MAKISIFTPTNNPRHLIDAYESLMAQSEQDWEWIVLLNGGGRIHAWDHRMKVYTDVETGRGVGYWKNKAVALCTAPILLELDHDDLLAPHCLREVLQAFDDNPGAGLVYTDTVQINVETEPDFTQYDLRHGWEYKIVSGKELFPEAHINHDDIDYQQTLSLAPTPHNVSLIWYAPNHARAFTRTAYDAVGGYNVQLTVLDDQDLMCRLYKYGEFVHIDKPLYLQRSHHGQTQVESETNAFIQKFTVDLYEVYLQDNLLAWCKRNNLRAIEVGCGLNKTEGYIGIDTIKLPGVDIVQTLPKLEKIKDESVGVIRAVDVFEHVKDSQAMMDEFYRVLAPGGMILSLTPSTDGRGAWQDPTHVSFWNENSFWYYTNNMHEVSPQNKDKKWFQVSRVQTLFPTDWHAENNISYVQANLIKPDPAVRNGGLI